LAFSYPKPPEHAPPEKGGIALTVDKIKPKPKVKKNSIILEGLKTEIDNFIYLGAFLILVGIFAMADAATAKTLAVAGAAVIINKIKAN
jgi:uncharacterized membrane protein